MKQVFNSSEVAMFGRNKIKLKAAIMREISISEMVLYILTALIFLLPQ